jgi:phytoene synthase
MRPDRLADDLRVCRSILQAGSKSFALAGLLLPRRTRDRAAALYAFCRVADDEVDVGEATPRALDGLRSRLDRIYAGSPEARPVDRALARVVEDIELPREVPFALLEGFAWDAQGRRYASLDELLTYAARVAGTVGAMMALVMGARSREALARACDLGVAMQLTNIARDVGEDASRGRLYLPLAWMREAGLDPDGWLARPSPDERLAGVVARLLAQADILYRRADAGIALLPRDCRLAIRTARLVYADIGRGIARAGFDSVSRRAHVSGLRKLWLVLRALGGSRAALAAGEPPIESTRFLVEACARGAPA